MYATDTIKRISLAILFATSLAAFPVSGQVNIGQEKRGEGYRNTENRIDNQTQRLVELARAQAEDAYREYGGRTSDTRFSTQLNMDKLYRTQSFSANAELFQRMARENRSDRDLLQALNYLSRQPYAGSRSTEIRQALQNIQQAMRNNGYNGNNGNGGGYGGGGYNGGGYNGGSQGSAGMVRWAGRVDADVYIYIQNGTTRTQTMSGQATFGDQATFSTPLPRRAMNVSINKKNGRGSVDIIQQPTSGNGYTAVVRIQDNDSGADNYEFEMTW